LSLARADVAEDPILARSFGLFAPARACGYTPAVARGFVTAELRLVVRTATYTHADRRTDSGARGKTKGGRVSSRATVKSMENVDSLVLEHLKALRNELRDFRQETREEFAALKNRVGSLEDQIANLHKQVASLHGDIAVIHARLDRIDNRLDRIETRLELVETP
jgi:chromosome segregation ATPase